jgi:hypothetical protein
VDFSRATFRERVPFWVTPEEQKKDNHIFGPQAWAWFDLCRIDKPELLEFNSVRLHPGWFINADVRKVNFTNVQWYGMPDGIEGTLDKEIDALTKGAPDMCPDKPPSYESPYTLLAQACRRLSANAEENREYPLANEFHYWSLDALRKESWDHLIWIREWIRKSGLRVARRCGLATTLRLVWSRIKIRRQSRPKSRFGLINTLYWALNGYGVRAARAFWILLAIWLVFAAVYLLLVESSPFWVFSASDIWQGLDYARQAAAYSLSALVRLNPRPQSEELNWFQTLVTIEGILGPLQIALLALSVRRRVMR